MASDREPRRHPARGPGGASRGIIRVVSIEDDRRYRSSLEQLLAHQPDLELVGSFESAEATLRASADASRWDLALVDLQLPGASGVELTAELKRRNPALAVVVLTAFEEPATVLAAICAGADGYLVKRTAPAQIVELLRSILVGGAPLTPGVARTVLDLVRSVPGAPARPPDRLQLTDREQEVLRELVAGRSYKQVASRLGISLDTVRTHVRSVYDKLQVHSVAEAVARAIREGIV